MRRPNGMNDPSGPALIQGMYYTVTGVWPLVSMGTFQLLTGRKRDLWLVQTAGALIALIGAALSLSAWKGRRIPEMPLLGIGTAVTLATIDILYWKRGVLRWVYLADAATELLLSAWWLVTLRRISGSERADE